MAEFSDFWQVYPSRHPHTNGRVEAEREWDKLAQHLGVGEKMRVVLGAGGYAAAMHEAGTDPRHIMQGRRFLHGLHWEQYADMEQDAAAAREKREAETLPRTAATLEQGAMSGRPELPFYLQEADVLACLAAGLIDVRTAAAYGVKAELREAK